MDTDNTKLVLRDTPILSWLAGVFFLGLAGVGLLWSGFPPEMSLLLAYGVAGVVGVLTLLLSSILTVTADRSERTLTLHHRSLVKESTRELLFSEIEAIEMEMSHSRQRSRSSSGPTYRIVVVLKDGEVVPFRNVFTSGSRDKTRKIEQLREFIGVGGSEMGMGLAGTLREGTRMAQREFQKQQEQLTGSQDEVRETNGVRWQAQTLAFGGSPITRWFSPDYRLPGGFVYITQVPEGQKLGGGGLLGNLSEMLYKQAMKIYGFGEEDTPGLERADILPLANASLAAFSVYTSAPAEAQRILDNPWVAGPLADWARRYPLKQVQAQNDGRPFAQLVVMYSPEGVYVASLGVMNPEALEELARLGVEMVKTQAGGAANPPA